MTLKSGVCLLITLLSIILCTAWGEQNNKKTLLISSEVVSELRNNSEVCGKQYGVDPNTLKRILDWPILDDKPHKQFLLCISIKSGYVYEDGHFNIDGMMKVDPVEDSREDFRKYLEDCNKITLENNFETVFEVSACLYKRYKLKFINESF